MKTFIGGIFGLTQGDLYGRPVSMDQLPKLMEQMRPFMPQPPTPKRQITRKMRAVRRRAMWRAK